MNLARFLEHWRIRENPFRGEEARHDSVFARMGTGRGALNRHSDFEKIVAELGRPSTSVVFGEKGSGKTAIRIQLAERVADHNHTTPDSKVLLVPYDELNRFLDQLYARHASSGKKADAGDALAKMRLVDHMDGISALATARIVASLLGGRGAGDLGDHPARKARALDPTLRRDLLILQVVYDTEDLDGRRTRALKRRVRAPGRSWAWVWQALTWLGWIPAAAGLWWIFTEFETREGTLYTGAQALTGGLGAAYLAILIKTQIWDRLAARRLGRRLHKQLRVLARSPEAYASSVRWLDSAARAPGTLPVTGSEEPRYAMLERLRRVLAPFGYTGVLVVMDRVDEPTLINGDADRMKSVVWPMFNNKFLQQEGLGLKLLLPIELRYALFKESNAFFQEARLDKQNLVERLTWTGATLYDLCNARLAACLEDGVTGVGLLDLFSEDVTRQDLVDSLDQMHQPRDAFKFLYRCLNEHCSNVTEDAGEWRVPRLVLEQIRKQEADRVQQLERGIRPA